MARHYNGQLSLTDTQQHRFRSIEPGVLIYRSHVLRFISGDSNTCRPIGIAALTFQSAPEGLNWRLAQQIISSDVTYA